MIRVIILVTLITGFGWFFLCVLDHMFDLGMKTNLMTFYNNMILCLLVSLIVVYCLMYSWVWDWMVLPWIYDCGETCLQILEVCLYCFEISYYDSIVSTQLNWVLLIHPMATITLMWASFFDDHKHNTILQLIYRSMIKDWCMQRLVSYPLISHSDLSTVFLLLMIHPLNMQR